MCGIGREGCVPTRTAIEAFIAVSAEQGGVTRPAIALIVPRPAGERVISGTAE
jgi:hypothetical protein